MTLADPPPSMEFSIMDFFFLNPSLIKNINKINDNDKVRSDIMYTFADHYSKSILLATIYNTFF